MSSLNTYAVLIVGGGPAGSSAAIELARHGLSVAILERTPCREPHFGQTLAPKAVMALHRLGVWQAFRRDEHLESPGIVSVWGSETPFEQDYLFGPYGCGWQIDRQRFDRMLSAACEGPGIRRLRDTRVISCVQNPSGIWQVSAQSSGQIVRLEANFLIDATGRTAWLARRCGGQRLATDRLVALIYSSAYRPNCKNNDPRTLVEAAEHGWWYSARLARDRLVTAYMTDDDLLPPAPRNLSRFWTDRLQQTAHARLQVVNHKNAMKLRIIAAGGTCLRPAVGDRWLAIGDAAMTWDPLSGLGICNALESGIWAASAIAKFFEGKIAALEDYARRLDDEFARYLQTYAQYYGRETRWSAACFWKRRQQG